MSKGDANRHLCGSVSGYSVAAADVSSGDDDGAIPSSPTDVRAAGRNAVVADVDHNTDVCVPLRVASLEASSPCDCSNSLGYSNPMSEGLAVILNNKGRGVSSRPVPKGVAVKGHATSRDVLNRPSPVGEIDAVRPAVVKVLFALVLVWIVLGKAVSDGRSPCLPSTDGPTVVHSHVISVLDTDGWSTDPSRASA
jgi:hypothetical protein